MKGLIVALLIAFCFLQYKLWFGTGSLMEVKKLEQARAEIKNDNESLRERNEALTAEVMDLKHGKEALEERARTELGMIKANENFYQIVDSDSLSDVEAE